MKEFSWKDAIQSIWHRPVIVMVFLGFSAGIPILLIFSTLSVWLREAEVSRVTIGFFSWAALGYAFKFVWAPIIDKLPLPYFNKIFGRRKSWLLLSQLAIVVSLILMAINDPSVSLSMTAVFAIILGFSSATQDIVIDAYRIETAIQEFQGLMSSGYITGYRIGMLVAGAGALELASFFESGQEYDFRAWSHTYLVMASIMLIVIIITLFIPEPSPPALRKEPVKERVDYFRFALFFIAGAAVFFGCFSLLFGSVEKVIGVLISKYELTFVAASFFVESLRLIISILVTFLFGKTVIQAEFITKELIVDIYFDPVLDFFNRYGKTAILIILLISTYRISDVVMGVMANVFYIDIGFEKEEIGRVIKGFGLIMTILGGFLGGLGILRYGIMRVLFVGAVMTASTNLLFVLLAERGHDLSMLIFVVSADNVSAGIASAAFVAYLSSLTNMAFTASQYALFSSLMILFPKILAGYSGMIVDFIGYTGFFYGTFFLGLPVIALIAFSMKIKSEIK